MWAVFKLILNLRLNFGQQFEIKTIYIIIFAEPKIIHGNPRSALISTLALIEDLAR